MRRRKYSVKRSPLKSWDRSRAEWRRAGWPGGQIRYIRNIRPICLACLAWLVCLAWLAWLGSGAELHAQALAQTPIDTEHDAQFWPDVQATFNLREEWSLFLFGTMRLGRDWATVTNEQLGFGAAKRFGPGLSTSLSYRHLHTEAVPGRHINEDRLFADLTPRRNLSKRVVLVDRNRFEWRRVNGQMMYRYRNRVQLERPVSVGEKRLTPYAAFEAFYDSRFRTWTRFQIYTGTRVPLSKHVTLDVFYMHQWDSRAIPGYIDVVGALWRLEF